MHLVSFLCEIIPFSGQKGQRETRPHTTVRNSYVQFVLYWNIIFDILEQSIFQKCTTCWVFLALCHMLYLCNCVFCICIFVFACLTHGNMIFVILEQSSLQKYTTCWVFLLLRHMLYLCVCVFCICIFVFACLTHGNMIFVILEQSSLQIYTTCCVFLTLYHMLYLCICVFCICAFDTWEYNFSYP